MNVLFLGTGTSVGVPVIACDCAVCRSANPKNKRLRTSIYLQSGGTHIVVDTTPDFRQQALKYALPRVDAILFTHGHADHIFGFDDIRRYNTVQEGMIPAYGSEATVQDLKRVFNYVRTEKTEGVYRPLTEFMTIGGPFRVGNVEIVPLEVEHDARHTLGYLFKADGRTFGYVPDCLRMPEPSLHQLRGVDLMVLDALRHKPHRTHLTVADSIAILKQIGAGKSYIIHMCHDLDHEETEKLMPPGMSVSYDGLSVEV